jgi:choline dehydrogenase-like flavoprotein
LHVTLSTARDALGDAVIAAAAQAGTPTVADINGIDAVRDGGFGRQPRTIWRGRRLSAATAFLKPALARPNLDVVTDTEVVRVELEGLRARGVRIVRDGAPHIVLAEGEVILCAGAIASPALLQRSGIGPAALLRAAGIQPIVDSPDVGRNLREHRTVSIHYRLTRGGHNAALRGIGLAGSVARYVLAKSGALTNATFDVGGFVKTAPGLDRPDGQIGVGLFSFGGKGIADYPGMTMFGYFMRPQSRGTLAIRSPDPAVAPVIDANFMAAPIDRERTVALLRHIRTIGAQPALAPHIAAETLPGVDCTSDEDLIEASFRFGSTGYHIAGTCRMGGDPDAVLDPLLRVRGIAGLRVVDTSIMPELVSGNTNAPAMAIAWRAAELILQGDGGSGIRARGERETAG